MNDNHLDIQLPEKIPFGEVINALLDAETTLAPRYLYRLSDLDPAEIRELGRIWGQIAPFRRKALLEDLEQLFGDDYLLSFEAICRLGLRDPDKEVRFLSVRSLFEYDAKDLIPTFLSLLTQDESADVRAASASALGKYVYEGSIEELNPRTLRRIEDALFGVLQGSDEVLVRRRALEALGFSSRRELRRLIQSAFDSKQPEWIVSALFAMGRSADKRWQTPVLEMLHHTLPDIRLEAARAAGEIELSEARSPLIELLGDFDSDVRMAAAWSLSQIGGDEVQEALDKLLLDIEDPDEAEFVEAAIDNLIFNQGLQLYGMFDLDEDVLDFDDDFEFEDDDNEDFEDDGD